MNEHDARWTESNQALVEVIREEIKSNGPVRFDRFMDLALYHPEHGYYCSAISRAGRAGDFITAPEAHPIFGATLAAQIVEFDQLLKHPDQFTIIEYGAGAGRLIRPLLAELRQTNPQLYERVQYYPVEINEKRLDELHSHLEDGGHAERLLHHQPANAIGCVIANEFLDAFPARRITRVGEALHEAYVDWDGNWFTETIIPLTDEHVLVYIERYGFELKDGNWLEFQPGIADWAAELANALERGYAMLIDYGYPASELFADHRTQGTIKGYYQHGVTEELYRGIGEQDLTVHVNLSEIEQATAAHGFQLIGITTQADMLGALGLGERLMRLQSHPEITSDNYLAVRAATLRMIDPGAMGRFRVMFLGRDVPTTRVRGLLAYGC